MNPFRAFLFIFLSIIYHATADIIPEGVGIIYGEDHVFSLQAPPQWVLDNEIAASNGVHAVFYRQGETWKDAEVVAYARARSITKEIKTVEDTVSWLIDDFHKNGSPKYEGQKMQEITAKSGATGFIYHFRGDQWGNFEAVCYFKEKKTINFIVLTSRNKSAFGSAQKAFLALCKSYTYISDHYIKNEVEQTR